MKIISARIYSLKIPLKLSFGHFLKTRSFSDSLIVELTTETGVTGYGEGTARCYVTGETTEKCALYLKEVLLPPILSRNIPKLEIKSTPEKSFSFLSNYFPARNRIAGVSPNAARAALELALLDCLLKEQKKPLGWILPAKRSSIFYTGVIGLSDLESTAKLAEKYREMGMLYIKIKVAAMRDIERIKLVRSILGRQTSIRLDANCAFSVKDAVRFIGSIERFEIAALEQPIKTSVPEDLALVRKVSSIPIIADESIVTERDAYILIRKKACDYFNLRISKCGGISAVLRLAGLAKSNGLGIQIGCHVGETAVLAAAARQLAAHLSEAEFVEGSFGELLLAEDISKEKVVFGKKGKAGVFTGTGLGIEIRRILLEKYSVGTICLRGA